MPIIIFYHIPKTTGSSVKELFSQKDFNKKKTELDNYLYNKYKNNIV